MLKGRCCLQIKNKVVAGQSEYYFFICIKLIHIDTDTHTYTHSFGYLYEVSGKVGNLEQWLPLENKGQVNKVICVFIVLYG